MPPRPTARSAHRPSVRSSARRSRHLVTAVLVAHDGARWLPDTLAALARQSRPAQRLVAVDTGSRDESAQLLADALGESTVLHLPRETGFGDAVQAGLAAFVGMPDTAEPGAGAPTARDRVEWIWLLHDDSAPEREALSAMLALAETMPSAAVIGPKAHAWSASDVITGVGYTVDRGGRRDSGLEPNELDQGQHDGTTDVLGVSTAGMLVRRDVWDALGGLDPALPLFRDDLDLCLRAHLAGHRVVVATNAVVRHAGAASSGLRQPDVPGGHPRAIDRYGALYSLLANADRRGLALGVPRLLVGSLVRALLLLLGKRPGDAVDELHALLRIVRALPRLVQVRSARAEQRTVSIRQIRHLFAGRGTWLRYYAEAAGRGLQRMLGETAVRRRGVETGPTELGEEIEFGAGLLRRTLTRPGVLLALGLTVVALVADRALLGNGLLQGGGLLPAPGGASDWWHEYATSWHAVGPGTTDAAPPYVVVLALLSTICFGKPWFVVDVLMLGAVPLAAITAYLAARRLTSSTSLRLWGAATYALLPALTGAVTGGRLGAVVGIILLPLVLLAAARVLVTDPRRGGWRRAWGAGLVLAVATAFAPLLYVVVVPVLVVWALALRVSAGPARRGSAVRRTAATVVVAVVPPVLMLPWSISVAHRPSLLLGVAGMPVGGVHPPVSPPTALFALWPGGPGLPPAWLYVPLLFAGLAGLLRLSGRTRANAGWTLALGGLAAALIVSGLTAGSPGGDGHVEGWPGIPTALMASGLLVAAVVAADGVRARLERRSFSWRQPLAGLLAVLTGLVPLAAALAWLVRGTDDPLQRGPATQLPAFVAADLDQPQHPRALLLAAGGAGDSPPGAPGSASVARYTMTSTVSPRLGQTDLVLLRTGRQALDRAVRGLAGGSDTTAAAALAAFGIRYVVVPAQGSATDLVRGVDLTAGLSRESTTGSAAVWQVAPKVSWAQVIDPALAGDVRRGTPIDIDAFAAHLPTPVVSGAHVPAGSADRLLTIAAVRDSGWTARLDGKRLAPVTAFGWAQGWRLPGHGGRLTISHDAAARHWWLVGEGLLLLAVLALATPPLRRPGAVGADT